MTRLVRFDYSFAPEDVMECLAVQTFMDDIRDEKTRRSLRLACLKNLMYALATAVEFEIAKEASLEHAKVRAVT